MAASKTNISDLLKKKGPAALRQPVQAIDIIQAASQETERENRTETAPDISNEFPTTIPDEKTPSKNPTEEAVLETVRNNLSEIENGKSKEKIVAEKEAGKVERKKRSPSSQANIERNTRTKKPRIYSEKDIHAILAVDKRETVRYSFEAYADQKEDIQRVCDLYEEATGRKLSASRLLREVLDSFLPGALKAFDQSEL